MARPPINGYCKSVSSKGRGVSVRCERVKM